jgi:hypothetical protein
MRESMNADRADTEPFKPSGGSHAQIADPAEHINRGTNMRLAGSIMIAGDDNSRDSLLGRQSMQLLGGPRHDAVQRPDGMKQITGMNADVRFYRDDFVDRFAKAPNDIFLTLRQAGRSATAMALAGSEVAIGKMADSHEA